MKKIEFILRETEEQANEANIPLEIEGREQALAGALLSAKRDLNDVKRTRDEALRSFVKGDDEALSLWIESRDDIVAIEKLISEIETMQKLLNEEVKG